MVTFPTFFRWVIRSVHSFDESFVPTRRDFSPISLGKVLGSMPLVSSLVVVLSLLVFSIFDIQWVGTFRTDLENLIKRCQGVQFEVYGLRSIHVVELSPRLCCRTCFEYFFSKDLKRFSAVQSGAHSRGAFRHFIPIQST